MLEGFLYYLSIPLVSLYFWSEMVLKYFLNQVPWEVNAVDNNVKGR